jgi:PAS domain S-box-containing protein
MKKGLNVKKILLTNQNDEDSRLLKQSFKYYSSKVEIITAQGTDKAVDILGSGHIDAVLAGYPSAASGPGIIRVIQERKIYVPVIAVIAEGSELQAAEAIKEGAYDYLINDGNYQSSLPRVLERIPSMSVLENEQQNGLEHQSILFKQIYRSQKWWQNIIDAITDYLFVIDNDHKILRTNKAFANLLGLEPADIIMRKYYELFGLNEPHEWCISPDNGEGRSPRSVERKLNDIDYLISSFPIYFDEQEAAVYIMKDITETRRLKDQVYHLDKLSSLGILTSGVAHEINNPLTGIIGYTEMMLMKSEDETTEKYLRKVYDSAIRCKRIVANMLTFSRQTPARKGVEDINDIIDKTIELHEYWLKSTNIKIIRNYGKTPFASVDRQQMQQVILNLLINAEHAIADTDRRGEIMIATRFESESNDTVIEISDNGKGIPQDILPKIFDPFFTTKPVNKGTGLGLSIAHGIIAEQGGTIEAMSRPGEGTSFIIRLHQTD